MDLVYFFWLHFSFRLVVYFSSGRQLSTSISFSPTLVSGVPLVSSTKLTPEIANCDSRPWRAKPSYDFIKPVDSTQNPNAQKYSFSFLLVFIFIFLIWIRKNSQVEKILQENIVLTQYETPTLQEKASTLQNQLDSFLKEDYEDSFKDKLEALRYSEEIETHDKICLDSPSNLLDPTYSIVDLGLCQFLCRLMMLSFLPIFYLPFSLLL